MPFHNKLPDLVGKPDAKYFKHMTRLLADLGYWNNFTQSDETVWDLVR